MSWFKDFFKGEEEIENDDTWSNETQNKPEFKLNVNNKKETKGNVDLKYNIIRPKKLEEVNEILSLISKNQIVTFVVDYLNKEEGQRLVDISSGAIKVSRGEIIMVSDKVYTCLPSGIEYNKVKKEENN